MIRKTIIGLLAVLAIGILTMPAYADNMSPYQQWNNGTPIDMITCKDDSKILMQSPFGKPACLTFDSANRLMDRGYIKVIVQTQVHPSSEIKLKEISDSETLGIQDNTIIEKSQTLKNLESSIVNHTISQPLLHTIKEPIIDNSDPCFDGIDDPTPYVMVTPTSYSITSGQFEKLCVQPHYKWYDIYLETDGPGTLTIEIPKEKVDLKQFDYKSCILENSLNTDVNGFYSFDDAALVKQISQTQHSRILEFTFDQAVSRISYFGVYGIIDGVDYSQPNFCIREYEENNFNPDKHLPRNEPEPDPPRQSCKTPIHLNYTITNGNLDEICSNGHQADYYRTGISFRVSNVTSNAEFIIDIPWKEMRPYVPPDIGNPKYYGDVDIPTRQTGDIFCRPSMELLFRDYEYQTLKVPLLEGATYVRIGWDDTSRLVQPFSRILDAIEPFDRSDDSYTVRCFHPDNTPYSSVTYHYPNGTEKLDYSVVDYNRDYNRDYSDYDYHRMNNTK